MSSFSRRWCRFSGAAAIVVVAGSLIPTFASAGTPHRKAPPQKIVERRVDEMDFYIESPARVRPGKVRLRVHNKGPADHELIVVRRGSSALPMRLDGLTVDEDVLESQTVGVLEPGRPGTVRSLKVRLRPGSYEMFCNMSGHYLGGMSATLVAR